MTLPRSAAPLVLLCGLVLIPASATAQFPLSPALWDESISLEVEGSSSMFAGSDPQAPEPHTETLSGTGYSTSGVIGFGMGGPPLGTAKVTWDLASGNPSLDLSSLVNIDFQARVIQTAEPPVAVSEVPVHVTAVGTAAVEDVFGTRATSFFRFQAFSPSVLVTNTLDLSGNSGMPASDSFSIDETPSVSVGMAILVGMSATASMGIVSNPSPAAGEATGTINPVIEIADEIIPGTSSSYRDFFAMEFSDGYDVQTPVERITISELKRRFGVRR